jgi:hypothetical protein
MIVIDNDHLIVKRVRETGRTRFRIPEKTKELMRSFDRGEGTDKLYVLEPPLPH